MNVTIASPIFLLVNSNLDLQLDMIDLQLHGLSDEEIEGYLEFFDITPKEISYDDI